MLHSNKILNFTSAKKYITEYQISNENFKHIYIHIYTSLINVHIIKNT